ncbi:EBP-domain-containing protein [Thozetella sp. PMI_491]|nr:EBP-domain-containing protein [Thozetella sp. PMI_491]
MQVPPEMEEQTFVFGNHPYYPLHVQVPNYVPNTAPIYLLLASFGTTIAIVVYTSLVLAKKYNANLRVWDQAVLCWFVLCGFLHCVFEGYFVLNSASIPASQTLFSQLWKEYSLSDSRYITSDPFMLCIESITVLVWGPLSIATAFSIAMGSNLRHVLQITVSIGHLYGVALYYGTCSFEYHLRGNSHSRPEFLYYWIYYVAFNMPWVIVPTVLISQSAKSIKKVFGAIQWIADKTAEVQRALKELDESDDMSERSESD